MAGLFETDIRPMRSTCLPHAVEQMTECGISEEQARAVLNNPDRELATAMCRRLYEQVWWPSTD